MKKKNRREDLNIDFQNETRQKYQELEERFKNNLKEQVVPILKSNVNKNIQKIMLLKYVIYLVQVLILLIIY